MKKSMIWARETVKWGFVVLVLGLSALHIFGSKAVWAPLDAYCPFGGLEASWKLISSGSFLEKTQPSNLALGLGLIIITLLFGGIFCGWICPLGTLQDGLNKLGRFLKLPQIKIPQKADKYLRWVRYLVLGLVLLESFSLLKLWFADYDPFRIIFGLHWIFDPTSVVFWGWVIGAAFIVLSLFWQRFWCKYLCPLGLIIQWLSKISWFRLRWNKSECKSCDLCSQKCPLALNVQEPKISGTACNSCLECVAHCPKPKALTYKAPIGQNQILALVGVGLFAAIIIVAQIGGWWNTKITADPDNIKGWMTLGYISETYHIPISEMKKELKLPASADEKTELRSFEKDIPNFEMDVIRNYVAKWVGASPVKKEETSVPASSEEKKAEPTAQPDSAQLRPEPPPSALPMNGDKAPQTKANPPTPSVRKETGVVRDPEEIKGMMSLTEVSEGWHIPMDVLLAKLGLPKDVDVQSAIRDLESYNVNGMKVREIVKDYLGQ